MTTQLPPGVNLSDDLGPAIIRDSVAVTALAIAFVVARLASRWLKKQAWTATEYLIVLAAIGCVVFTGLLVHDADLGLGKHIEIVPLPKVKRIFLSVFISEIFYTITLVCIKISILLLYRGLFPNHAMRMATSFVGIFVLLWGTAVLLVAIFSCTPVQGFWVLDLQPAPKCINQRNFFIGNSIPNIVADAVILCLPINQVWGLNMSSRQKWAVSAMFLLGGFVVVASCIRMKFLLSIDNLDPTYTYYGVGVWSAVELDVALLSACLPTLRPLLSKVSGFATSIRSKSNKTNPSTRDNFSFKKPSTREHDEEFQRLPESSYATQDGNVELDTVKHSWKARTTIKHDHEASSDDAA